MKSALNLHETFFWCFLFAGHLPQFAHFAHSLPSYLIKWLNIIQLVRKMLSFIQFAKHLIEWLIKSYSCDVYIIFSKIQFTILQNNLPMIESRIKLLSQNGSRNTVNCNRNSIIRSNEATFMVIILRNIPGKPRITTANGTMSLVNLGNLVIEEQWCDTSQFLS